MPVNTDYITLGAQRLTPPSILPDNSGVIDDAFDRTSARVKAGFDDALTNQSSIMGLRSQTQQQQLQDNLMRQLGPNASSADAALVQQYQKSIGEALPIRPDGTIDMDQVRRKVAQYTTDRELLTSSRAVSQNLKKEATGLGINIFNPDGTEKTDQQLSAEIAAKGGGVGKVKRSEAQDKALLFKEEMKTADVALQGALAGGYDPTGRSGGWWKKMRNMADFLLPDNAFFDSLFRSDDFLRYRAAFTQWIGPALYQRSGAQISERELERGMVAFFPMPGDPQATVDAKARLREKTMQMLEVIANGEVDPKGKAPAELAAEELGMSLGGATAPNVSTEVEQARALGVKITDNGDGTFSVNGQVYPSKAAAADGLRAILAAQTASGVGRSAAGGENLDEILGGKPAAAQTAPATPPASNVPIVGATAPTTLPSFNFSAPPPRPSATLAPVAPDVRDRLNSLLAPVQPYTPLTKPIKTLPIIRSR